MNELIKLQPQTTNGTTIETVSARELHAFVESKQQFATWIKNRISEYDFVENQDFVCVSQKNETQRADGQIGVSVSNEYYITLDMAKELSMVERNQDAFVIMRKVGGAHVNYKDDLPRNIISAIVSHRH